MGREVDLMVNYPRSKRDISERAVTKTEEDRHLARQFGEAYFDGQRKHGYGGFNYHPRFWQPAIPTFKAFYGLTKEHSVLDVGCAKGFMLYDFTQLIPGIKVRGIDISQYAIENAIEPVKDFVSVGDARCLEFEDNSFDFVLSITTLHNFEEEECAQALMEIERVSRGHSFITVGAYRNETEKKLMHAWNLTAKTVMHVDEWKAFFKKVGYTGDYHWFMP